MTDNERVQAAIARLRTTEDPWRDDVMLVCDSLEQAAAQREEIRAALKFGVKMVQNTLSHISHGGPSRQDAQEWVDMAIRALKGTPAQGEKEMSELVPTYYVRHLDDSYSVANPQPKILTPLPGIAPPSWEKGKWQEFDVPSQGEKK